jgi:small GTP-binding protein
MTADDHPPVPRVITLGDSGVGKTALIARMKTDQFLDTTSTTIGAGVTLLELDLDSRHFSLQIWDTAGQELYRSIIPVYFRGAILALLVFSITDLKSFQHLDGWLQEIGQHADTDIGTVLVASKFDRDDAQVEEDEAKKYADDHRLKLFFTSSLTGQNVQSLLQYIAAALAERTGAVNQPEMQEAVLKLETQKKCC